MERTKFEPFGEEVNLAESAEVESRASRWVMWVGSALFWTLAFPILFVILFGTIFSGGGTPSYTIGWVDQDHTPASARLNSTCPIQWYAAPWLGGLVIAQCVLDSTRSRALG